jgi:hypothetical protein
MPPVPGALVLAAALYEQGAVPMQPSLHENRPEREPRVSKVPRGRQLLNHWCDAARAAIVSWVLALAARRRRCEALPRLQPRVHQYDWVRWPRHGRGRGRVWERLLQAEACRPVLLRLRPRARARVWNPALLQQSQLRVRDVHGNVSRPHASRLVGTARYRHSCPAHQQLHALLALVQLRMVTSPAGYIPQDQDRSKVLLPRRRRQPAARAHLIRADHLQHAGYLCGSVPF